jgi:S1-C subfamily serine protease
LAGRFTKDKLGIGMENKSEMQKLLYIFLTLIPLLFAVKGCVVPAPSGPSGIMSPSPNRSIVRVNVTRQGYNFRRPWQQKAPSTGTAIGVIINGPRVLVSSQLIANHRYIELERADTREKSTARVEAVDYETNLALLQPTDQHFLEDMHPLELDTGAVRGDYLSVWQVQKTGNVETSEGPITSIEMARYPYGNAFLAYRLNSSLQYRINNLTLPVVKDGKLAGLLMRYNSKEQTVDVISAPVIEHFLKDAFHGKYDGFPSAGFRIVPAEDPQLRRYMGITSITGGVYVQVVTRGSAAERGGLREGDIIMEIAGFSIDSRGNYEHPRYGKISIAHLTRCNVHVGDTVLFKVFRAGKILTLDIVPDHRPSASYLVPPYLIDTAPRYYILGGLILQELSLPYLREFGSRWSLSAPTNLVYYAKNQSFIDVGGREKIVILSRVMPTSYTVGYENLSNLVITRINHRAIGRLEDVVSALETPVNGFHKIEFEHAPKMIYLDPLEIPKIESRIQKLYNLPALKNLN